MMKLSSKRIIKKANNFVSVISMEEETEDIVFRHLQIVLKFSIKIILQYIKLNSKRLIIEQFRTWNVGISVLNNPSCHEL